MADLIRAERREVVPAEGGQGTARGRQYLSFMVGQEAFGVEISGIKEIIEYRAPTEVPMMPAYMRGVINLRGRVVPVIDLSVRFGRAPLTVARRTCIVIVEIQHEGEQIDLGVAVDAVSAVLEIADGNIEPAPSFGAKLRADFILGMGKVAEKFVIILDIAKVLSVEELASLVEAGQTAGAETGAAG